MNKRKNFLRVLLVVLVIVVLVPINVMAAPSKGRQIYFNDFDGGLTVAPKVTATLGGVTSTEPVQGYDGIGSPGNSFGGLFLRNTSGGGEPPRTPGSPTTLTLTGLPPHISVDINFLLAIIDSWDGSEPGEDPGGCLDCHPDIFTVTVDGVTVFSEAFGFNGPVFDPPPGVLLAEYTPLGFNTEFDDAAYDMSLNPAFDNIPHTAESLTVEWFASGDGWQGGDDESWAIDNVEVVLEKKAPKMAPGKVCLVEEFFPEPDFDSPFNKSAVEGLIEASKKLKVDIEILGAATPEDVPANIDFFVASGECDLIFGVGFSVAWEMVSYISDNPHQKFALLDSGSFYDFPNLAEITYSVDEAGFLAGYIAAGISETGTVGVFGGMPIPGVTPFMDGYALGVEYYNSRYGTSVEVLGWDPYSQVGLFTWDFVNPELGQQFAEDLFDQGADIVFPVAGPTGLGALEEAINRKSSGETVWVIGVDYDWYERFGDSERVILTSVIKDNAPAVFNQVEALVNDEWVPGIVWEGLESGAVDITKFHNTNRDVPGHLKNDLKGIREGIIDGSIPTMPPP